MKLLLLIALLGSAFAIKQQNDDEECVKCQQTTEILFQSFQLPKEVKEQIELLQGFICPLMGDGDPAEVNRCVEFVGSYWDRMLKSVLEDEETPNGVCEALGFCQFVKKALLNSFQEEPCTECLEFVGGLAQFLQEEFGIFYIIDILGSELFCGAADISPDRPDKYECRKFVEEFIPLAVPLLAEDIFINSKYICQTYLEVCREFKIVNNF